MKVHSIHFDIDQIFFTNLENTPNGLFLNYINSISSNDLSPIDLENINNYPQITDELIRICLEAGDADSIAITLPTESVLLSYIPGDINMESSQIKQMIELEINNSFPENSIDDFTIILYDFAEKMDGNKMMIAAIIPNIFLRNINNILAPVGLPISKINISQFANNNSLLYNYPEQKEKAVALLNFEKEYIDLTVMKYGKPIYLSKIYYDSTEEIATILEDEFNIIMTNYVDYVETAFFCGKYLTADILQRGEAKLAEFLMTGVRLNTFKMIRTNLEQREKDYCARTAHIYSSSIGAILPNIGNESVFKY